MPHKDIEDRRKYARQYLASHPEAKLKSKEANKRWREEHKEEIKEKRRIAYSKNKESNRKIAREYYHLNKKKQLDTHIERAHKAKIEAIKLKGSKCSICSLEYNGKNASVFDFHHINPEEKDFMPKRVLNSGLSKRAKEELAKCALVCANCHRLVHNSEY